MKKLRIESISERSYSVINVGILGVIALVMVLPFVHVFSISSSSGLAVDTGRVTFWPVDFTTSAWSYIVTNQRMLQSIWINTVITVGGTLNAMFFSILFAYPLSKPYFRWGRWIMFLTVFTMVFRYPVIPYFLVVKGMGLCDNLWAMIIPSTINAYHIIIMRTFFRQLPVELEEAAEVEGANDWQILWRVTIPLSKPMLATIGLFYAVIQWNLFFHPLLLIRSDYLIPLQLRLREMIAGAGALVEMGLLTTRQNFTSESAKAAAVLFATIPILLVYPALQKYFVKGAMLGSIKG